MIIDVNAFLGHYAFRRLRHNSAMELLAIMDHFGIARACVASAEAILYRDSHMGNVMLHEETLPYPERFWCYATINPAYAEWRHDLRECLDWGFKGLRLYPKHHGYSLQDLETARLIGAAAEAGMAVSIPSRVEDPRQRHWRDIEATVSIEEVLSAAEAHPKATFILTESVPPLQPDSTIWTRMRRVNFYLEMSRMTALMENSIGFLMQHLGDDRILFGTGLPFKTPSASFLKMLALDASDDAKQKVFRDNAWHIFGDSLLKPQSEK